MRDPTIKNKKPLAALILFSFFVLSLTLNDYIVHEELYDYGLTFSYDWAVKYWINYSLLYQLAIISLFLFCRDKLFLLAAEVFTLTSSQDIIFFGLWNNGKFPAGSWNWTIYYFWVGEWTTQQQIFLSLAANMLVFLAIVGLKYRKYFYSKSS